MKFRFTIIGAGVVGLAIAGKLAEEEREEGAVLLVEQENTFGRGISSRNSEVIHSGIYYPQGTLKHKLCVRGRKLLYEYCHCKDVPHKKCGKLIISTCAAEEAELEKLYLKSELNCIENTEHLTREEALRLEPHINAQAALYLKETGIIDSHYLMKSFYKDITDNKGIVLFNNSVVALDYKKAYKVSLRDGTKFSSDYVINAAGLSASAIAALLNIRVPEVYPCKGVYFSYAGKISCRHLIYPVPEENLTGLGVHVTIDMGGRIRFGPDVEYINNCSDYTVEEGKKALFFEAAKKIFPQILPEELFPDMAGIRPKIQGPQDNEVRDFYIQEETAKGFPGLVNLVGIESPGLTCCLAIAELVREQLQFPQA